MSGVDVAERVRGRGRALVAFGDAAGVRRGAAPGDQHLERGERRVRLAGCELGVAEEAQAVATIVRQRHLVGSGEGGLGELCGAGRVTGRQGQLGAGHEQSEVVASIPLRDQFERSVEVRLSFVEAAGGALDVDQVEPDADGVPRVAQRLAERQCLGEPRTCPVDVATSEHDRAEDEPGRWPGPSRRRQSCC